ncbi:hypothetical protein QJS10_CPA02g01049 [Acorus calamus]|uniref:Clp R domain-containing protein n=1 Tax=Acorus calamus TaxID=4465 RepID=A0AAV9FCD0_ACOCL|nr:hypothetical protein QJS10_CPA02g01049 [Acorus calamus]
MRTGGYTSQHALTPEAAGLVKQAVGQAHRRGHAQVTPLHVANTMLSSSSSSSAGLLRSACLNSHSHPLQCKALELCLNVALNRLPSSSSSTSSLSNALDPIIRSPSIDKEGHHLQRFKEFNTENLKSLCNSLQQAVPWQSELAPDIAGIVLQCRSGMMKRRAKSQSGGAKEDTWLLFQGGDVEGKEKVCRELTRVVFGSRSKLTSIRMSSISVRADSMEDMKNKRTRYDKSSALLERFMEAVRFDPHRVFMVEDVEQVDYSWWLSLKRSIEDGKVCDSNGEEVAFGNAIVVLSCESFDSNSRACSPALKQKRDQVEEEMVEGEEGSFDLNLVVEDHADGGFAFDGGVGLVEVVDRCFFFKLKEDL